jgi:hypothetical protein
MKTIRKYSLSLFFSAIILFVFFFISCDQPIPSQDKSVIPSDHTDIKQYAYHKYGARHPFAIDPITGETGCASDRCHHSDLKGGYARFNGKIASAPSCYQCHGKFWE